MAVGPPLVVEDPGELAAYFLVDESLVEANVLLLDVGYLTGVGETPHLKSESDDYFYCLPLVAIHNLDFSSFFHRRRKIIVAKNTTI